MPVCVTFKVINADGFIEWDSDDEWLLIALTGAGAKSTNQTHTQRLVQMALHDQITPLQCWSIGLSFTPKKDRSQNYLSTLK